MSYKIKIKKGARKDLRIKGNYLEKNFSKLVYQLKDNPYQNNQSFEKLVPPILGFYSRRINIQHRVVYKVNEEKKEVVIYSAWGRYD